MEYTWAAVNKLLVRVIECNVTLL